MLRKLLSEQHCKNLLYCLYLHTRSEYGLTEDLTFLNYT